ncbi:MAG: zinc-binding dehydrogenase [Pseudomonadales bacterium]|jgi:(R,R)-butanediol dehydrogenase/meso-butanediol dehydrogenase/diacetyl reductase|nr:zinc-binding dehydrogenase [Pseudomonadales bacterium]MDP7360102.1 zinc-binding dehydrogenase [Pseudomonadales bacterium]MDP7597979.1 zinc-binding dehydrogenase [Pseudomonadales bacterium]HJN52642.1 zinc-binding dehydrogenase [Pseudomonadales bacterium]
MKACVATGEKRRVECKDIQTPTVEPGWLLLKTTYACICGSDLEYLDGSFDLISHGVSHAGDSPLSGIRPGSIPGHEFVAEVVEVGEGAKGWAVGDRAVPLGHPDPRGIGVPAPGYENYKCMAEYFLSTPFGLQKVPDHVADEEAVFVEPLCTGNGAVATAGVRPGQSVVVIGAGKIGLLAAMAAKVAGASPVISIDLVESRLDKAREVGVDAALNANVVDVITEVAKLTGEGPDAILICVRDGRVLNQAAEMANRGASIVLAGFVSPMEVNPMLWTVKRLKVIGILGGSMIDSMYMIAHKQIDPKPLISEVIPLDDCQRAIDSVYSGENIAVLLTA